VVPAKHAARAGGFDLLKSALLLNGNVLIETAAA
jgi:hypothetical protein